jgi:hypothetical protein
MVIEPAEWASMFVGGRVGFWIGLVVSEETYQARRSTQTAQSQNTRFG